MTEKNEPSKELSPVKRALVAMQKMRARIEDLEYAQSEPIAVIGIGCRFPGSVHSKEDFWKLLDEGVDAIREVPADRYNLDEFYDADTAAPGKIHSRWGGFLDQIDEFDSEFFGINPREATTLDPQQRLLLEVAYEAFQDAGYTLSQLSGSRTGVYAGVYSRDYGQLTNANLDLIDPYTSTGDDHGFGPNRVSYFFNLHGPSMPVNTHCSASLVSIHLGCGALRTGECDMVLAGGVNLHLTPGLTLGVSKLRALSPDGRCKTFDSRANGFVRAEGCGLVVLKRLSDAERDGDRILGVVRGSAVNQDGRGNGLTQPNMLAQKALLSDALRVAGIEPGDLDYIETHGTGTELGDPIEVEAISSVVNGKRERPLVLGAVKSNIGHLETAAGVAGLIKVLLALKHKRIPGNLHFQKLNPHISLDEKQLQIPVQPVEWPAAKDSQRYAGVSSFGMGGTNAHMILSDAPASPRETKDVVDGIAAAGLADAPLILTISGHNPEALRLMADRYQSFLSESDAKLEDICYNALVYRDQHRYRMAVVGHEKGDLAAALENYLSDADHPRVASGENDPRRRFRPVFVFAGLQASAPEATRMTELMTVSAAFREKIEECEAIIQNLAGWSLIEAIESDPTGVKLQNKDTALAASFAHQFALVAFLQSLELQPAAVVGNDAGAAAAAHVAGILSLEEALTLAYHCGRLSEGGVLLSKASVAEFTKSVGAISGKAGRVPFYSGLTGELFDGARATSQHWASAVSQPGKFAQAISGIVEKDQSLFIEISSSDHIAAQLDAAAAETTRFSIGDAGLATLLTALAALHCNGVPVRLERLHMTRAPHIDLPLYAWTRQRFWIDVAFKDAVYGGGISRQPAEAQLVAGADQDADWERLIAGASADEAAAAERPRLLVFSNDDAAALDEQAGTYRDWLKGKDAEIGMRALCSTAAQHSSHHTHRMSVVASTGTEMAELLDEVLAGGSSPFVNRAEAASGAPRVVFVFSGQGSQWPQMARTLIEQEPVFRDKVNEIEALLSEYADWSLTEELNKAESDSRLGETEIAQPAIFALQVGLVAVLSHYGIQPDALAGHSVGEVAAAHISGALDLEAAVRVIYHRALVMQKATGLGRMAAAGISPEDAQQYINGNEDRVAVGAHNSPDSIVFSGEEQAVQKIFDSLPDGVFKMMLPVNYAFHSPIMEPFQAELAEALGGVSAQAPRIPVYSTVTGELVEGEEFGAEYWPRNMRDAVAFAPVIDSIARDNSGAVFVEIGAHNVLSVPVEQCLTKAGVPGTVVPTLRRNMDSFRMVLAATGRLFAAGAGIDWRNLFADAGQAQLSLPVASASASALDGESLVDWMYQLEWTQASAPDEVQAPISHWLILCDTQGIGKALAELAEAAGQEVVLVFPGDSFQELDRGQYSVRPDSQADFNKLRDTLIQTAPESQFTVVHLWATDSLAVEEITVESIEAVHQRVLMSAARLIQSQHSVPSDHRPRVRFVTAGVQSLNGETPAALVESTLWGFARAVAMEHPLAWGGLIDLESGLEPADAARILYSEFQNGSPEDYVCVRANERYVARMTHIKPIAAQSTRIDSASSYMITGGLTGIGLLVARWLIQNGATHLTLLGRTPLPDRSEWDSVHKESVLERIKAVQHLEGLGATIITAAVDTSNEEQFAGFLKSYASEKHPAIKGVIHSAGVLEGRSVMDLEPDALRKVLQPKVDGGWVLHKCLRDADLDFFVLFSSVSGTVTGLADGLANYAAANSFLDYLAVYRRAQGLPATSVIWGPWADTGFAAQSETGNRMIENLLSRGIHSLSSRRGLRILDASIGSDLAAPIAIRIDWDRFYKTMQQAAVSPLYSNLVAQAAAVPSAQAGGAAASGAEGSPDGALTLQHLAEATEEEREKLVQTYMARHVAEIMRYPIARLDVNRPLKEIGIDSLMGVELRNRIQNDLNYELSAARIVDGSSIVQLASFVIKNLELPFAAAGQQYAEAPLSAEQEGVFFLTQLAPQVSVANVHSAYLLDAEFNAAGISSALGELSERYDVLRTAVVAKTGVATQLIFEAVTPDFEIIDSASIDEEEIFDLLSREIETGFELAEAPLLRVRLYPLESGAHILLAVAHSIALDEGSLKKVCRELLQTAAGQAPVDPPVSFQEYAQARVAKSESESKADREFWCEYLKGDMPAMRLPVTRSIPPLHTYRAETVGFDLAEDVVAGVQSLGGLEPVILAAYTAMLARITGHDDVPVGLYLRLPDGDESIVGAMTNLVILRAKVGDDSSFADFVGQITEMLGDIRKHGAYPFQDIIRETNPLRDPARSPVVPFTVHFTEAGEAAPLLEELGVDALDLDKTETFDEMAALCHSGPEGVRLEFRFKAELYSAATMEQFAASLNTLLESAVRDPQRPLGEIDYNAVPVDEQIQKIWQENPESVTADPRENSLLPSGDLRTPVVHELVDDVANMVPGAVAVLSGKRRLAYSELSQKADQLAQYLLGKGLKPGSAVVICMGRSPEFLISVLGVLKAGYAVVPLDPAYSIARLNIFLNDSKAKLMLTLEHYEERFDDSKVELVLVDKEAKSIFKKASKKKPIPEYDPEATAFVFYSTKNKVLPLGTEVDHKAFTHSLKYYVQSSSLGLGARTLHYNSVNSLVAYYEIFATLVTGGSLILRSKKDRHDSDLVKFMQENYIERIFVAQGLLRGISRVAYEQDLAPRYLREINLIGDRMSVTQQLIEMLEKLGYCEVNYRFTLLETGTFANYRLADLRSGDWPDYLPIGRPVDGTQMYILDDRLRKVPLGFIGELYVGGSSLARGYRGHPTATKESFLKDPFAKKKGARMFKTGMRARYNLNGQIQLVGSEDRSAKFRGRSMNLREIELVIEEHPAIAEAYVTQNKDLGANGVIAFIVSDRIVDRLITTIYCHVEYDSKDKSKEKVTLVTQDVSSGGLRLQGIPADWKVGMELRMTLLLPGFFDEFRVQGEVKWIRQGQAGVEFNTSPVEESMLKKSLAYLLELEQFTMAHESQMPRVPIRRRCSVELETGQRIDLTASEISTSGISVLDAPDSWEIGKKVFITLNLPGIIEPPRMLCTLAWRDKKNRTGFNFDPNQEARERLHEFIMHFKEHQQLSITQLRTFLQTRLAYYLIPTSFVILGSLPEFPDGTINDTALRFPDNNYYEAELTYVSPRTSIEGVIQTVWVEVLNREYATVGIYNNFFDLGGDSLLAIVAVSRIGEELDIDLPVRSLYLAPTISELGKIVLQRKAQREKDLALDEALKELENLSQDDLKQIVRSQLLEEEEG